MLFSWPINAVLRLCVCVRCLQQLTNIFAYDEVKCPQRKIAILSSRPAARQSIVFVHSLCAVCVSVCKSSHAKQSTSSFRITFATLLSFLILMRCNVMSLANNRATFPCHSTNGELQCTPCVACSRQYETLAVLHAPYRYNTIH